MFGFNRSAKLPAPYVTPSDKPDYVIFLDGRNLGEALLACDQHIRDNPKGRFIYMWEKPSTSIDQKPLLLRRQFNSEQAKGFDVTKGIYTPWKEGRTNIHYDLFDQALDLHKPFGGLTISICESISGMGTFVYRPLPRDISDDLKNMALKQHLQKKVPPELEKILGDPVCPQPGQLIFIVPGQFLEQANLHGLPTKNYEGKAGRILSLATPL